MSNHNLVINTENGLSLDPKAFTDFESKATVLKMHVREKILRAIENFPNGLHGRLQANCILSGSCISSIYHNEEVKDFDLWCKNDFLINEIAEEIKTKYLDEIAEYKDEDGYDTLREGNLGNEKVITNNAISLKNKVQYITLGKYASQRKLFDFMHCLPYYDLNGDKLYISPRQMQVIDRKLLVENPGGKRPLGWRISKFQKRGWVWERSF
jgi:hypothetical protein